VPAHKRAGSSAQSGINRGKGVSALPSQRIIKIRRDYNTWVANETFEDYALRFTPRSFRKWSSFRVANTAFGAVSFLALEAIGGAIALNYGFSNALWAILVVGLIIFLTGLPISYYAAKYGLDMDLLTRGAGFGYLGSTVTSLIYASFTFIFFALEAAIMALALELYFGMPLPVGYLVSALAVIPLVMHGVTLLSRLQLWTQPLWLVLLVLPFVAVWLKNPDVYHQFTTFHGRAEDGREFNLLLFGAAATVAFSLIAQIGEQVDFLRFMPEKNRRNRAGWWSAVLVAGPGWIVPGMLKMVAGAFLAFLALQHQIPIERAVEPTQMYLVGFRYVFDNYDWALAATALFVIVSQVKINVTNAYAGSLAWSNFFARLTHSHPGRVVWLLFNVLIATALMVLGVFEALEHVLGLYSNVAIAWVGALVADLVVNKPLGLSPKGIEFKRAHLYDINPVGFGAMLVASVVGILAYVGVFGDAARALSPFIALGVAFFTAPLIAFATRGRYYLARKAAPLPPGTHSLTCSICENRFESEDMAHCPAYGGHICSLCCTLDARCEDRCKDRARMSDQVLSALQKLLPMNVAAKLNSRIGLYVVVLTSVTALLGAVLGLIYLQESITAGVLSSAAAEHLGVAFVKIFAVLVLIAAVASWWIVLASESRRVAQEESSRQTQLLMREIEAHRRTDEQLQRAKEVAEAASLAKSRFVTGMSHELRTPLNGILGYAQILQKDEGMPAHRREAVSVIRRSGEHLLSLIDGLLDIARIEAGRLRLDRSELRLPEFLDQIVRMFRLQAENKGLTFRFEVQGRLPEVVHADPKRLRQILMNLVANAVKFTDSGTVRLRVGYRRELAYFDIEDTGCGIAASDLERIFQPFERGESDSSNIEGGTGLGLTITKLLVELMGGDINLSSTPGKGSVFSVRLYLPEAAASSAVPAQHPDVSGYAGPVKTVLIVDNQSDERQFLATLLVPLGFRVIEASNGIECLRAARLHNPDLVLLDIGMPGIDGWETCRRLRSDRGFAGPVIMVSANAFDNTPALREQGRCDDFIVKPVLEAELLAKLQLHLALDWTCRDPLDDGAARSPSIAGFAVPPEQALAELRRLAEIGYVKGIQRKLAEIESAAPAYAPFLNALRARLERFQLEEFQRLLQAPAHAAEQP
jgi:signal transduction histidine kinase/CheY-like chemotaxis protein/purine-cytosine permease-like protein